MKLETTKLICWDNFAPEALTPLIDRQYFNSDRLTVARFVLKKGAVVPEHKHENEQVSHVLQGALRFKMEGREITVRSGEMLYIPPYIPHAAEAIEDSLVSDFFCPPRSDWDAKQDTYLRG